ncbi:class I SAM-dependent methyltransferase [Gracilinema caldarium]|uniref:Methyltransferase type 11 n=1 Tax=Gracilinema caldarium (strain ATCC 51460 / DSM 7334 / H1) TaxID=744872 RepID=F8EXG3_GRAC1|nr:class I SAM-dependent methyltransferase [Gracilinema caldarium]AEJ19190.1 Methyltransferase type 11 [Gracilinema caldarium DSM 7334]
MKSIKTWSTPVVQEQKHFIPCNLCGSTSFAQHFHCEGFSYVRCTNCGLVQQNPQPDTMAIHARYEDHSSQAYLQYELANETAFLKLQQMGLQDIGFFNIEATLLEQEGRHPKVLDVGCATGALLSWLRDRGWDSLGIELCRPAADYARNTRKLSIISGTIESAGVPAASVNVVLASHVIEHVTNPKSFVTELYRSLKPGGYCFITTPSIDGIQARLFGSRWRSAIFDHLYLFSKKTLRVLLEEAGFTVEKIISWGGLAQGTAPGPIKNLADRLAKRFNWGDVVLMRCRKASAQ